MGKQRELSSSSSLGCPQGDCLPKCMAVWREGGGGATTLAPFLFPPAPAHPSPLPPPPPPLASAPAPAGIRAKARRGWVRKEGGEGCMVVEGEEGEGFVAADCLPFCLHSYRERRRRRRRNSAEKKDWKMTQRKVLFSAGTIAILSFFPLSLFNESLSPQQKCP